MRASTFASENFSTSLADMDNMLKEHVSAGFPFCFFSTFLIISASVFLMNIYMWIIWMPWVVDAGVNFANTINQLCAQILQRSYLCRAYHGRHFDLKRSI